MLILSFESSCDETSAAVVKITDDTVTDSSVINAADSTKSPPEIHREILSNIVRSQISIHKLYGGVVPEIASRAHTEAVSNMTYEALAEAGVSLSQIDVIGVTNTPGLIGALLVGVSFAKSLAYANSIPLVPVNHIKGHVAANYFKYQDLTPPFIALVASGGHTSLLKVNSYTSYETIGRTRDDAIGEAFDKVARVMGLCYPGGAEMDRLASLGDPESVKFPSAAISDDTLDFSFSGLKTSVVNYIHTAEQRFSAQGTKNADAEAGTNAGADAGAYSREDVAAAFTSTVVASVIKKLGMAFDRYGAELSEPCLVLAGGVSANSHLRLAAEKFAKKRGIRLCMPPLSLCGDNGAMIGAQAFYEAAEGNFAFPSLNAYA